MNNKPNETTKQQASDFLEANAPKLAVRHNEGKAQLSYIFDAPFAVVGKIRVKEKGAEKYHRGNWRDGRPWMDCLDSLVRHALLYAAGQDRDKESGELHMDHIQCNAEFLSEWYHIHPELDDRPKLTEAQIELLEKILIGDV